MKPFTIFCTIAIIFLSITTTSMIENTLENMHIRSQQKGQKGLHKARPSPGDENFAKDQNQMYKKRASVTDKKPREEHERVKSVTISPEYQNAQNMGVSEEPFENLDSTMFSLRHFNLKDGLNQFLKQHFHGFSLEQEKDSQGNSQSQLTKERKLANGRDKALLRSFSSDGERTPKKKDRIENLRTKRSVLKTIPKKSEQNVTNQENYCTLMQKKYQNGKSTCNIICKKCCKQDLAKIRNVTSLINTTAMLGSEYDYDDQNGIRSTCSYEDSSNHTQAIDHIAFSWACIDNIWMIASCTRDWKGRKVRYKCQKGSSFTDSSVTIDYGIYQVPVATPDGLVFRNRFCARCNSYNTFEAYKVAFACNMPPPGGYTSQRIRGYLFKKCKNPRWIPGKDQPRVPCPIITPLCHKTKPSIKQSKETLSRKHLCVKCNKMEMINCAENPDVIGTGGTESHNFNGLKLKKMPMSLVVPFNFLEEPRKHRLVEFTCIGENTVYDPYLERCRQGVIPKPEQEAFSSYRVRIFFRNATPNETFTLLAFKTFLMDTSGADGVRYFNDKLVGKELQFDIIIQQPRAMQLRSAYNNEPIKSIYDKLDKLLKLNQTIKINISGSVFTIFKVTYRILTCIDVTTYEKNEYALLEGYKPAVYINETHETLSYHNYFTLGSGKIGACRTHLELPTNCTGVIATFNSSEYKKVNDHTVYVVSSRKFHHKMEYSIIKDKLWLCVHFGKSFTSRRDNFDANGNILAILTTVCMSISNIALVFVLVTYSLFAELRTPPGINLMNLSVSILLSQLLWLTGSGQTDKPSTCFAMAVLLHYFFLVSFVWTSIIAFDTWKAFTAKGRRNKRKRRVHCLRYMAVGWLSVMIYEIALVVIDQSSILKIYVGNHCWIAIPTVNLYVTVIPVSAMIVWNTIFFVMTVTAIRKTHKQSKLISNNSDSKQHFAIYVRIAVLMGFTWIFAFIAPFGWSFLWYPHVVLNSSQGVYIALAFGLNKRARKHYKDMYRDKSAKNKTIQASTRMSLLGSSRRKISGNSHVANKAIDRA